MSSSLPYPTSAQANSFPWPDEGQIQGDFNQNPSSPSSAPYPPESSTPYPNYNTPYPPNAGYDPYANQAPYPPPTAPNVPYPYPPAAAPGASNLPYPMAPGPPVNPYPPAPGPYPSSSPYPASSDPSVPYIPATGEDYVTSSNVNLNEGPGKIFSKSKGLSKVLNTGLKIAEDAISKGNIGNIGNIFPQPSAPSQPPPTDNYPNYPNYPPAAPAPPSSNYNDYPDGNAMHRPMIFNSSKVKRFANQSYEDLKRSCQRSGSLFKDPEFPASNRLLVDDQSQFVFSYFGNNVRIGDSSIEWLRPTEICRNPEMFVGELDRFDINQGEIGNCWFLAALANLAENKKCFQRVVPSGQSFGRDYCGIFRFRFWRFGEWVEVVIDDRLPTRRGQLIYVRSVERNEFWSALLEKAYAKLHGSYKALEGGLTIEAAVDFTGGIPEMIDLQRCKMSPERIFYIMSKADARNAFMGCALSNSPRVTEAQRKGLQSRHAYTITKVVEIRSRSVRGGIPLIRLRNPHGNNREWRGEWSDGDRNWQSIPSHMRAQLGLTYEDDGEFYMSFRDFLRYFGELEICHLSPESVESADNAKKFEVFNFFGNWRYGSTAGGCGNDGLRSFCMNPQFFINISDPDPYDDETHCPVVISLLQKQLKRKSEHAIGFKLYSCDLQARRLNEQFMSRNNSIDRTDAFINLREISKRILLPQGRYCIIPCTFKRGEEGDFLLRVFVERRWGSSEAVRGEAVKDSMDYGGGGGQNSFDFNRGVAGLHLDDGGQIDEGRKKKKSGRDKVVGFALKKLEENFPQHSKGLKKLKDFYNWATDSESEFALLNNIIKSLR